MRLLFTMDKKDYNDTMPRFVRPSVRGIILMDGKVAMVHSLKYDYYKFPGGGIEPMEDHARTLIREVGEETGLQVLPESIQPYGRVFRAQRGERGDVLIQDNFYYFCHVAQNRSITHLDAYEQEERFTLEYVTPSHAMDTNRIAMEGQLVADPVYAAMAERELLVLQLLTEEKYV